MSVLSQPGAASVPSGAVALYRTLAAWYTRMRGTVFLVTLAAGVLAGLVRAGNPFAAWIAGLLFGWPGVLGASVGQLFGAWAVQDGFLAGFLPGSGLAVSVALSGAAAFLIFCHVPGIGRGLPTLRSYVWLLLSAMLGSLLTAFGASVVLGGFPGPRFWNGAAEGLVAALLLGPPALLVADRHLRRWMEQIPGEKPARSPRLLAAGASPVLPGLVDTGGQETVVLSTRSLPAGRRVLLVGAGLVLALTLAVVPLSVLLPRGGSWAVLLYVIPILWSANQFGLRGGVLAASASGLFYLAGAWWIGVSGFGDGADVWSRCADLVILSLVGAFVGRSREHEVRMRDELADSNRLLRRDLLRVAQALTQAVEAKDSYTEGHLRRVSEYAVAVGSRLGLRGRDLEMIHYASMLHDIGKIGIPEEILRKRGPLSEQEAEVMRRHADIGARLLEKLDLLRDAAPIVRAHQERYDGAMDATRYPGYPMGLMGDEIPLGARIIAVVDAFDAMTTTRPYRAALPVESAIAELRGQRGRQFDPRVVDAFLDELAERPWVREESWH